MDLYRDSLFGATHQSKTNTEGVSDTVQSPVLIVGLKGKALKAFNLGTGVGIANGLIDPGRADLDIHKRLAGELATLGFG